MKKTLIFLLCTSCLTACATMGGTSWVGQNFDNYVLSQGVPTSQYTLQDGSITYSFKKTCEYDSVKTGETLVVVGEDNLIQRISTPTGCPSYYDTPEYKYQQEIRLREKNDKKRIKDLEGSLKGIEMNISLHKTMINSHQLSIDYQKNRGNMEAVREYEEKLKKEQEELRKDEQYKAQWEREKRELEAMYR